MKATIRKEFTFAAAHHLPRVEGGHPCSRVHGHTWTVVVEVRGKILSDGFVIDFRKLKKFTEPTINELDHSNLNDHLKNPTSENLAVMFLQELPFATAIEVRESPTSMCRMERDDLLD